MEKYLYGYKIVTELDLPYINDFAGESTDKIINVRFGENPFTLINPLYENEYLVVSDEAILYKIPNVGSFLIKRDNEENCIIIERDNKATVGDIGAFLVGSITGCVLIKNGELSLHASAVLHNKKTILISGDSGSGKSTTQAEFLKHGAGLIADDVSVLSLSEKGMFSVASGHPNCRLWENSAKTLGFLIEEKHRIRPSEDKFWIPMKDKFIAQPQPVNCMIVLRKHNVPNLRVKELKGIAKVKEVRNQIFQNYLPELLNLQKEYFTKCSEFANTIQLFLVERPLEGFYQTEIITEITNRIK